MLTTYHVYLSKIEINIIDFPRLGVSGLGKFVKKGPKVRYFQTTF